MSIDNNDRCVFTLCRARERLQEWDHPWTQQETELQALVDDNLFEGGDSHELAALVAALEEQRQRDNHDYRTNREAFDRIQLIQFTESKMYFDNMRTQKNE